MKQHSDLISRKNFLMTVLGYPHTHFDKTLPKAIAAWKLLRKTQVRRHAVRQLQQPTAVNPPPPPPGPTGPSPRIGDS
jgi:hypothetical protein